MKNPKHTKIIAKIPKIRLKKPPGTYVMKYTVGHHLSIKFEELHDCKKGVWSTFGWKVGQSDAIMMKLQLDMLCHLLNVYTKFQIDISKHV